MKKPCEEWARAEAPRKTLIRGRAGLIGHIQRRCRRQPDGGWGGIWTGATTEEEGWILAPINRRY
jgi:hypothetical protein